MELSREIKGAKEAADAVNKPKSIWDGVKDAPFRWSTPRPIHGRYPLPWRTVNREGARDLLESLFPELSIYVELSGATEQQTYSEHESCVIGLRYVTNKKKRRYLCRQVLDKLASLNYLVLPTEDQDAVVLFDDLRRNVLKEGK